MKLKKGKYRHYKGKHCEVLWLALHSETGEELVIYRNCEDSQVTGEEQLRARPYTIFVDEIEKDGKKVSRFSFVGEKE